MRRRQLRTSRSQELATGVQVTSTSSSTTPRRCWWANGSRFGRGSSAPGVCCPRDCSWSTGTWTSDGETMQEPEQDQEREQEEPSPVPAEPPPPPPPAALPRRWPEPPLEPIIIAS